ncbi:aminotransferase class-III [Aspergillus steynii IBT 23096]|uniref:4-aminobutyrate aminotransferase n=1 Tax=Aspergillus steynii IBT 23096 TaxID=1392250 RepID=A0A2I2GE59_9EURO|nr:aminotransferase class-III [Aspergillus steynii IBT 23096]PLB51175.1 aminotransferase class-III [Aspergillus steynii IBT 23096]
MAVQLLEVPGAVSKSLSGRLGAKLDSRAVQFFADYQQSHDNFLVDVDGNEFLDVYAQIASNAVGYNNPTVVKASTSNEMALALSNRPCLGVYPGAHLADNIDSIMRIAPRGHNMMFPAQSGSEANELAFKAAFFLYQLKKRGLGAEWTQDELESCLRNEEPGSPKLSILSFKDSFHGRGFGSLSTTRSKPIHKLDVPAFDWPMARFPALQYPLESNVDKNREEVESCLKEVDELMSTWRDPVAAIIVEPIQSEGGDNHAPASFFQGLQDLTRKHGALLIVDEVQTGFGATGSFWAHESWNLREPADLVTFGKKAQMAGYFFGDKTLKPDKAYRQFNTWMGDEARLIVCNAIIDEILEKDLVTKVSAVGNALYNALEKLAQSYPDRVRNLRGKGAGTYIAFDTDGAAALCNKMKLLGVNIGNCGKNTVRLRPMLIFEEKYIPRLIAALVNAFKLPDSVQPGFATF